MIFGARPKPINFKSDPLPNAMGHLMVWDYGRKWLEDRDAFVEKRLNKNQNPKTKLNSKSVQVWLDKRMNAKPRRAFRI